MSRSSIAKNLKGPGLLSSRLTGQLEDAILGAISNGTIIFNNVDITSGTINGVVIGNDTPGPGNFTTIQSGTPAGQGFQVCFFGQTVGDSACWEPVIGRWNIQGDLLVRDISDLGNLRINSNSISSTNLNGNITIDPSGTGIINLIGPVTQSSVTGNVSFNSLNFNASAANKINLTSSKTTSISSSTRDVILNSAVPATRNITFLTSGINPTVTTSTAHSYEVGDRVDIATSGYSGTFVISEVNSTTSFRIIGNNNPSIKTSGTSTRQSDIYLNAYGTGNVKIPEGIKLSFTDDNRVSLVSSGEDLTIDSSTTYITGNLVVEGQTTTIDTIVTKLKDPVITLGETPGIPSRDFKDRGVEVKYVNSSSQSKTGFFGREDSSGCFVYIPDAVNTNEVFTGPYGCAKFGSLSVSSLSIANGGTVSTPLLNVCNIICPVNLLLDSPKVTFTGAVDNLRETTEHISGNVSPSTSIHITYIDVVTGTGSGVLSSPGPNKDGFKKTIACSLLGSGSFYTLSCPSGILLDPGSGTTLAKTVKFDSPGQSVVLLWDSTKNFYIPLSGNACVY